MNILFIHRDFPGQFKYLIWALTKIPNCKIFFITEDKNIQIEGVEKITYTVAPKEYDSEDSFLKRYENILAHAQAATEKAKELKEKGIIPDVIYGFNPWGLNLFMKDIFPNIPLISYCEWFYNSKGADIGFDGRTFSDDAMGQMRLKNSHLLIDLYSSDICVSPTNWQKQQFPKEFHDKIKVIHDGVSADIFKPDNNAKFIIPDKNIELTSSVGSLPHHQEVENNLVLTTKDEVITYATRGMELYRGFPQFMEAVEKLLKKRPNAHIVIAGCDKAFYGTMLKNETYKEHMLKKLNLDMNRVHFVGILPSEQYLKLLQISSVHVYMTFPFILSWSFMEAMSTGCCIVASNTPPVTEIIKDNYNGLLVNFFDIGNLVKKIEYALDNKEKMEEIKNNARKTIIENYDIKIVLPKQVDLINSLL